MKLWVRTFVTTFHFGGRSKNKEAFKWKQLSGKIKESWGKLTHDDLTVVSGKRDRLVGRLQERYGLAKEQVEHQIDEFMRSLRKSESRHQASKTPCAG